MKYQEFIERAPLVREVHSCVTTGDPEYPGTALEVSELDGREILYVVVDGSDERQVLFLSAPETFRMPLSLLEEIVSKAKELVGQVDG